MRISHMLDHVAAEDDVKSPCRQWYRLSIGAYEWNLLQAVFIEPLAGQHQPTQGDVNTDDSLWRDIVFDE
jgi:hypothetical protein